jgi:hypothetical protein
VLERADGAAVFSYRLPDAGLSGTVLGCSHNPEVAGSNPAPATKKLQVNGLIAGYSGQAFDCLSVVCPRERPPQRGTPRAGSGENGTVDGCRGELCERGGAAS